MPSLQRWSGKVAVVSGASSGIGAAICMDLARAGLVVIGLARRVELVEVSATVSISGRMSSPFNQRLCRK